MKTWSKMNKTKAVLEHLQKYGYIDSWTADKLYKSLRLSAIIYNLRYKYNLNIITEEIPFTDIYGTNSSYAKYILVKEEDND